jgi:hypothetical protein
MRNCGQSEFRSTEIPSHQLSLPTRVYRYEAEIMRLRRELEARGGPPAQGQGPPGSSTSGPPLIGPPPNLGDHSPGERRGPLASGMEVDRPLPTTLPNLPPPGMNNGDSSRSMP